MNAPSRNAKRSQRRKKAKYLARTREERYRSLVDIGIALSTEKELQPVLDLILDKALETTRADGASIYLTENIRIDSIGNSGRKFHTVLRFHRSANRSTGKVHQNKVLDLDSSSIAGFVAMTAQPLVVDDCYALPPSAPFKFNPDFDKEIGYRTCSMLTVPMVASGGRVRGVLQMVNKLNEVTGEAEPFTPEDRELMQAFASQACVAVENAKLTEDIENLFESFIRASVTAIEARDPATSGHSDRVAVLTVEFARAVHRAQTGPYKTLYFTDAQVRELRYAALLHDFGKIGVRESILTKGKKLYPQEMETILARLESARARQEMMAWKEMAHELVEMLESAQAQQDPTARLSGPLEGARFKLGKVAQKIDKFSQQLNQVRMSILNANQPQVVERDFDIATLMSWINKAAAELNHELLTPDEVVKLSLPKGSLSPDERREIESHVTHTYHFLRQIAWTEDLSSVAEIAHAHHEKCDGSGYPRGITAESIPVQSRMMAISDIYDALTSMDRPYKKALQPERALDILHTEANAGKLDFDLLKVFIEAEIFRSVMGMARTRKAA